jgi:drug/metabolite transporter (DMT)-like permease
MECISLRRLFGLTLGISGVLVLLLPQFGVGTRAVAMIWLAVTMCIPACFAGESILLALAKSFSLDVIAATVIIFVMSTVILLGSVDELTHVTV